MRAFACRCVPSDPLLSRLDGLFYFLACCAVMGCFLVVLVLVLVVGGGDGPISAGGTSKNRRFLMVTKYF
jgi:hypothetical protein